MLKFSLLNKDAWIVTNGYLHGGLLNNLAQSIRCVEYSKTNKKLVMLGISNWYTTSGRYNLISDKRNVILISVFNLNIQLKITFVFTKV
jgi:hypothetical protein